LKLELIETRKSGNDDHGDDAGDDTVVDVV
jgi:hypothetical protein